jgi:hypothetical protein
VDREEHGAASPPSPGEPRGGFAEDLGRAGSTTTKQAAKVLGVSRRSVQSYVARGMLEAREEGEGVNRRFLISIDSLNALVDRRRREANEAANLAEASPRGGDVERSFADTGEGLRHLIERLEARTAEATELRIRLEITERAQSSLEEERAKALDELADEHRRREEAEAERDELRQRLEAPPEDPEFTESSGPSEEAQTSVDASGEAQEAAEQRGERRGWFRRYFGF